ncbi:unnamed protein product, partial [Closterium sp. NIES-64]
CSRPQRTTWTSPALRSSPTVSYSPIALQNPPPRPMPTSPVPAPFSPSLSSLSSHSSLPHASNFGIPDPSEALAHTPPLYAMPPGQSIDATWLAYLADFCCLGSLRLDNCRYVTDSALSMLSGILEMLSQVLTQLHVVGCVFMFDVHALEHLSLTNCPLLTASFLATILLPCLPALLATIMLWVIMPLRSSRPPPLAPCFPPVSPLFPPCLSLVPSLVQSPPLLPSSLPHILPLPMSCLSSLPFPHFPPSGPSFPRCSLWSPLDYPSFTPC